VVSTSPKSSCDTESVTWALSRAETNISRKVIFLIGTKVGRIEIRRLGRTERLCRKSRL